MSDNFLDPIVEDILSEDILSDIVSSENNAMTTVYSSLDSSDQIIATDISLLSDSIYDDDAPSSYSEPIELVSYDANQGLTIYTASPEYISSSSSFEKPISQEALQSMFEIYNGSPSSSHSSTKTIDSESMTMDSKSMTMDSGSMTMNSESMMNHHPVHMLLPTGEETATALQSGSWFDSNTWGGAIPADGEKVLIPAGIDVYYDGESLARVDTVRVDGSLIFAPNKNTKLIVDTLFSTENGLVQIGSEGEAIHADKTAQIIIDSEDAVSDAMQLGKGLILSGVTRIYGTEKLDFVTLQDAQAGADKLVLNLPPGEMAPAGWQIGDQLVLGGTAYNASGSDNDNTRFQDEVLTITAINGNEISFTNNDIDSATGDNTVLRFDHVRPDGFETQVNLYVANTTRNVSVRTENGKDVPIENRGHVMFMHNDDVQVKNAGFYELGRSNKNEIVDEVVTNKDGSEGSGSNVRGRYALHFHRSGADDINSVAAVARGNAVVGSPGWGIVHHDSHAILEDNVVFDVLGAGIVAEAGNEIGRWSNNITIKTTGDEDPSEGFDHSKARVKNFDMGFNGEGYWLQGAGQVLMTDNVAVSAAGAGLTVFGGADGGASARDKQVIQVSNLPGEWQDIAKGRGDESVVDVSAVPLLGVSGMEVYNSEKGILTWGSMLNSDGQLSMDVPGSDTVETAVPAHPYRSSIDDFQLWNIRNNGVQLWYASQYDLSNGLILADTSIHPNGRGAGIANNGKNHTFTNLHIEDFKVGIQLPNDYGGDTGGALHRDMISSVIRDSYVSGALTNFSLFDNDNHYLQLEDNTFGVTNAVNNTSPTASFSVSEVGGLAYHFDASASYDIDPWSAASKYETQGIIAYGWDFDNDSVIDTFGREVDHSFTVPGSQSVALTVWDQLGQATTVSQTIDIQPNAYVNAFLNGDFSENSFLNYNSGSSVYADAGWGKRGSAYLDPEGVFVLSDGDDWSSGVGQVVQDNHIRQGLQRLSLDLKNINASSASHKRNQISLSVWGINGQFENTLSEASPKQSGALAMESVRLLNVGLGDVDSNEWQTRSWELDFGTGFQYLLAEIHMKKGHQAGDYVAIDNFRLTGDGNFELGALSLATGIDEFRSSSIDSSSTFDSSSLIQTMGTKEQDVLTVTTDYEKIEGTGERDRISGSKGDNIINGGDGGDILKGGAGHDELLGGNGRDILEGGSGDDLLYGGQDQDILTGGAGMDIFVIALGDGPFDQINDFTARKDLVGLSNNLTFGQLTIEQAGIQDVMISANGEYLAKFINTRVGDFTEESFVST